MKNNYIQLQNKINKDEYEKLYLSNKAKEIINLALERVPIRANNKHLLFKWCNTSRQFVTRKLIGCMDKLNLRKGSNATHIFRKSFITRQSVKKDINMIQFQQIARIKDFKTAQNHYIKKKENELVELLNS
ncbi:MAG: hypothetical protein NTW25_05425 [Candidatus Kapabacteria bacterium]|nr:hypothetical protein [Candidatus Kapabacteria bacterium]